VKVKAELITSLRPWQMALILLKSIFRAPFLNISFLDIIFNTFNLILFMEKELFHAASYTISKLNIPIFDGISLPDAHFYFFPL
jgi:hypothetical protein